VLSGTCFQCHGPDPNTRMAGLRLDIREEALAARKTGAAIVPGKPEQSTLYQRLVHTSASLRMPPAHSHKTVTESQKSTIRRWIEEGAVWKEHWSFAPPRRADPPQVRAAKWIRNPLDRFVLARLEAAGLAPAPEADRRTLIRRVALDTTGLPPTPAETEQFLRDKSPAAYESMVGRYLASDRWGEHRGRFWLDAARYGDTHGIHVDNYREMWPYRDWVIQAFNRNLPFDRFTIEQIAGDLLPNRTLDQQIATGFHRCNVTTNEAGVIVEEIEAMYAKDRVETTATVWLGLTLGCASCHDHKFDPLSQRDFYSMAAFFRNTGQDAMDGNVPDTPPVVVVPRAEDRERWSAINAQEQRARERMTAAAAKAEPSTRAGDAPLTGQIFAHTTKAEFERDKSLDLPPVELDAAKPFSLAVTFYFPKGEEGFVVASQSDPADKNRGWHLEIGARVVNFRLVGDDAKQITIRAGHMEQLVPGSSNHVAVSYDGSREQAGLALYVNGKAPPNQGAGDQNTQLPGRISVSAPLRLGRNLPGGSISDFRIFAAPMTADQARLTRLWPDRAQNPEALRLYSQIHHDADYRQASEELAALNQERRAIRKRGAITHVMNERMDQSPFAHILYRGAYDQKRDRVEPLTPAVLPPMSSRLPKNRLGLAQWLMDPANPLTARVTVNRFWQELFGTGLVRSAEDFGSQGIPPANQALLDWLAVEFRESGWDVKKLFELMLTSATYRQAATATPAKLEKDPLNEMLSRGPRFRMDGEMLRDQALAASGLLTLDIGGPSVKPLQPEGIWEAVAMLGSNTRFYRADEGAKLYRRSLYTFWKRSAPPSSMEIFNAPTREACTVRRERTNTPLQALVTMNDVQFVEAARMLAKRAAQAAASEPAQLNYIAGQVLARPFDAKEMRVALEALNGYRGYYESNPGEAAKLAGPGQARLAALTMAANQILNLDEALTK